MIGTDWYDVDDDDVDGWPNNPVEQALVMENPDKLKLALDNMTQAQIADLNQANRLLADYAKELDNNLELLNILLSHSLIFNALLADARSVIKICVVMGHEALLKTLCQINDITKNIASYDNEALRLACASGHLNIVIYLLTFDNVYNQATAKENAALRMAIEGGHSHVVDYLLMIPAIKSQINSADAFPMREYARQRDFDGLDKMYRLGGDINVACRDRQVSDAVAQKRFQAYQVIKAYLNAYQRYIDDQAADHNLEGNNDDNLLDKMASTFGMRIPASIIFSELPFMNTSSSDMALVYKLEDIALNFNSQAKENHTNDNSSKSQYR